MRPDVLFLHRVDQMAILLESHAEGELLDLARVLRQLFLDKNSLVDAVNKATKLTFEVGAFWPAPDPLAVVHSMEDGIDPATGRPGRPALSLSRDEFFRHVVMYSNGDPISIKDVVKYAANVAGGVHYTPDPKQDEYRIMHALQRYYVGNLPTGIRQLKAIARVALVGLKPLIADVRQRSA